MNVLVTGANGQLGNEMRLMAQNSSHHYIFTDVEELDITCLLYTSPSPRDRG